MTTDVIEMEWMEYDTAAERARREQLRAQWREHHLQRAAFRRHHGAKRAAHHEARAAKYARR
jgi:hypothetical protein